MQAKSSLPADVLWGSFSRIHFSPTGEKWMRDKRTPKDVRGEAKLSQAATKLFAIFFYNILHPVTTVIE